MSDHRHHYYWAFLEKIAPLAISFVVSVFIARIVGPEAYGLVAMLGIFMALGQAFTELGFGAALVQRTEMHEDDETSVFYVNLFAGIVILAVLCAISPLVARFFGQEILVPMLCAQSLGLLVASAGLVQFALISRRMQFRLGAMIEVAATVVSGAVGLAMAYRGHGVWSLVGLGLSREVMRVAAAWIVSDWRPRGRFSWVRVKAMWSYCSKLLAASLLHRLTTNLNTVLIGRLFPPADLGLYARAAGLQALPTGVIAGIVQRVAFPLFSRNQSDRELLRGTIRRQARMLALMAALMMGLLAALAPDLVPWLLGPAWLGAVPLLQIMCLAGVLASVFPLHSNMTMALGESDLFFKVELAKKVAVVAALVAAAQFGITAFAWAVVAISVSDYLLSAFPSTRLVSYTWGMQAHDLLPPAMLAAASALVVHVLPTPTDWPVLARMAAKSASFLTAAALGLLALRRPFFQDAWQLAQSALTATGARLLPRT